MKNVTESEVGPPGPETSDYVGIGLLAGMLCVGGPLNVLSLFRSLGIDVKKNLRSCYSCYNKTMRNSDRVRSRRSNFTLNFHLTLANLLVIWVYVLSEVCWRITYQWLGGDALCRLVRFVHAFCFYATSNLVSTIALDRLYMAVRIDRPGQASASARNNAIRWFAKCSWTLAFLCSLPQLYVWRTFEPFPGVQWQQCVTVWVIERYAVTANISAVTVSERGVRSSEEEETFIEQTRLLERVNLHEEIYNALHLAFVFWLPIFVIMLCYALIVTRFNRDIRKRSTIDASSFAETETLSTANQTTTPTLQSRSPRPRRGRKCSVRLGQNESNELTIDTVTQLENETPFKRCCLPFQPIRKINSGRSKHRQQPASIRQISNEPSAAKNDPSASNQINAAHLGAGQPLLQSNFAATTLTRARRRAVRKSVGILLAYFVCWSPYNVLSLWRYLDPDFEHAFLEILNDLIVLNAVINPLIYGI